MASPVITISRREVFSSAHQLWNPLLSAEENRELYGKCSVLHGHNYELEVIHKGAIDPRTGYLFDLKELKEIVRTHIIRHVDHANLNDVPFLKGTMTSAENVAVAFWNILSLHLPAGVLYAVRLHETENNAVEYRGENR